jgi:uroporphyrinogen decarboxylase
MTHKQLFEATLKREKVGGRVPTFELVFFLTMEFMGKVHTSQRCYAQWYQMSAKERELQLQDTIQPITTFQTPKQVAKYI